MIPVGSTLQPRRKTDPVVKVVGIAEPDRYTLQPVDFGDVFALDYDEITATYRCDDFTVAIPAYDEAAEWRKLSREKFHGLMRSQQRKQKQQAALPTPEQALAAAEAK